MYLPFRSFVMLLKNLPFPEALWKIPLRVLLDWLFALKCLLQKDTQSFMAIFKAHGGVIRWMGINYKYQKLPSKKVKKIPGVYGGLLIWAYFVRGKKHFSEIVKPGK